MSGRRLTVVLSQTRSKNPAKRRLEEEIVASLIMDSGVDVSVVPHVYDLTADHSGTLFLKSLGGDVVFLAWLFPRAVHWLLYRLGVKGRLGSTLLKSAGEEEDAEEGDKQPGEAGSLSGIVTEAEIPSRRIYGLDLRADASPKAYIDEIRRIAAETAVPVVQIGGLAPAAPNPLQVINFTGSDAPALRHRWYPVIDFSRCTNCMECIDFCLFGVYGVDIVDRILVEQPDNCRTGCPACSRVCPENAIIFPDHKSPAIAGAAGEGPAALKIDLSKLFGGSDKDSIDIAAEERDAELVKAGRDAVGLSVGIPKRQVGKLNKPADELDQLLDQLDDL